MEYFLDLCSLVPALKDAVSPAQASSLRSLYLSFGAADAADVKRIEAVTNHDVKAVEYFLKRKFDGLGLGHVKEFIHFALTSQDVNHVALPLMLRDALASCYVPELRRLIAELRAAALAWDHQPMLARTHGQPATPTRMGKVRNT